ncbi:MAG: adenylate/guanylate cyclase domain-containing protein [Aestuariivirgaceae bacterium]
MKQTLALPDVLKETLARDDTRLPARVLKTIARQENSSEVLVKLIQLTVVTIWALLYLLSPKTDLGTSFSPVPYALGGYLVLNVIGLYWAMRRTLPNWAVYFSIFVDVAMLMVLIWSFHIQYRQPASFYLKAPTLLYIFIFIALRALRFQARFVIAAGLSAAVGWMLLTLYVVLSNPADNMITRNYVDYLTSNSVLVGAEVDKIISILLVTTIIALALKRANSLLIQSVTEQTAARDLSRFFDESVAEQIRTADHVVMSGEGVRRQAAILFVDIRGFTPMAAELDASEVVAILSAYEKRIVPIIQRNGGTIDKFLGDGIMATFGAVADSTAYAADAIRAIDEIMADVENWHQQPELRRIKPHNVNASVAAGAIVFGALGGENRLEYTAIGAAVNLAAKLEKHNKSVGSRALTDLPTWETALVQGYVPVVETDTVTMPVASVGEDMQLRRLYRL